MHRSSRVVLASATGLAAVLGGVAAQANIGDPIARLTGRWAGQGSVVPARGATEDFKCVVTYRPVDGGARLQQNIRCKSANYSLETATKLQFTGNVVSGEWEEKTNALGGTVTGAVTDGGFQIHLAGRFFQADMTVAGSGCEQSVKVVPVKADYIKELAANLKKC